MAQVGSAARQGVFAGTGAGSVRHGPVSRRCANLSVLQGLSGGFGRDLQQQLLDKCFPSPFLLLNNVSSYQQDHRASAFFYIEAKMVVINRLTKIKLLL